jgi:hypothetical protein
MPMKKILSKRAALTAMLSAMVFAVCVQADTLQAPQLLERHRIVALGAETMPELSAHLVDPEKKAQEQTATVEVKVEGIQLIDPAAVHDEPQRGQGHLHYQVDSGPLIATTTTKLSFHELSSGAHKITVMLVGNDHQALGPRETLTVNIPPASGDRAQR